MTLHYQEDRLHLNSRLARVLKRRDRNSIQICQDRQQGDGILQFSCLEIKAFLLIYLFLDALFDAFFLIDTFI